VGTGSQGDTGDVGPVWTMLQQTFSHVTDGGTADEDAGCVGGKGAGDVVAGCFGKDGVNVERGQMMEVDAYLGERLGQGAEVA